MKLVLGFCGDDEIDRGIVQKGGFASTEDGRGFTETITAVRLQGAILITEPVMCNCRSSVFPVQ